MRNDVPTGLGTTAITLCLGHSLGMHRRFIHRSYAAPLWLERLFVYLGTLVGMAGPLGMMRTHDLRDRAQRQPECDLPHRPELRPMPSTPSIYPLTLLYDRRCAVCRLEMDDLRARDDESKLRFIDISEDGFDAVPWGATQDELNAVIHARDAQGKTHNGVPALRLAYAAVGRSWLLAPTGWPILRPLCDAFYVWFARHRYGISRRLSPLIETIAAARLARRMHRCAGGVCER
jgi:predicted DCC family thiol-disulfide oxidoreductase YuxK